MKKLICTICLASFLQLTACNSLSSGVKTIARCCNQLSGDKMTEGDTEPENTSAPDYKKAGTLLPFNSWDAKMMIW